MAATPLRLALPLALPLSLSTGCRPPPDAPAQLEELTSWLYGKVEVGTDEELEVGVNNLSAWLDGRMDEAREGYTVDNLPRATANEADGRNGDLEGLVGASVATTIEAGLHDVEVAMMLDDQMDVFEGEYLSFDRTFDGNPRCFVRQECDTEAARTLSVNNYPLGLELTVDFRSQWRWVETDDGPTVIYRTWLRKEADVNKDWLSVHYQYFLGVNMPYKGKTRRLQTTWIAASLGDTPVPEDMALNMVIDGMIATDDTLTGYLNGL
jgi:hypothetical protein